MTLNLPMLDVIPLLRSTKGGVVRIQTMNDARQWGEAQAATAEEDIYTVRLTGAQLRLLRQLAQEEYQFDYREEEEIDDLVDALFRAEEAVA